MPSGGSCRRTVQFCTEKTGTEVEGEGCARAFLGHKRSSWVETGSTDYNTYLKCRYLHGNTHATAHRYRAASIVAVLQPCRKQSTPCSGRDKQQGAGVEKPHVGTEQDFAPQLARLSQGRGGGEPGTEPYTDRGSPPLPPLGFHPPFPRGTGAAHPPPRPAGAFLSGDFSRRPEERARGQEQRLQPQHVGLKPPSRYPATRGPAAP